MAVNTCGIYHLRQLVAKDAALMCEWMKDKDISKAFSFDSDKISEIDTLNFINAAQNDAHNLHFAVVDASDTYLGTVSLKNIDTTNRNAEYAISLRRCALGKGVAQAATRLILDIAFGSEMLNRVYLYVETDNIRANKFYRKIGFNFDGTSKEHLMRNGQYKNLNWYSVIRREYAGMELPPSA